MHPAAAAVGMIAEEIQAIQLLGRKLPNRLFQLDDGCDLGMGGLRCTNQAPLGGLLLVVAPCPVVEFFEDRNALAFVLRASLQIVMSRTFGNASPQGGVGVRMCVPLIDMLNHAGDEAVGGLLSTGDVMAQDNVRWDVVSPTNSSSGSWEMVLSSTRAIPQGEPLLLSYREGPNEEFLLCYGFVPASNPHDTVQLFGGLTEALEQLWQQDLAQVRALRSTSALDVLHCKLSLEMPSS